MDKGFATFFYFGNKKVVLTSITPTPSSSIKNSRNLIAPLFLSLLCLFSLSSLFFLYLPQRKKCRGNYDHHDHTKDPEHGEQQLC